MMPDFLIIGAAKSGTTSLFQMLGQHPRVFLSPIKEPNYFSDDIRIENFSATYRKNTFLNTERYFAQEALPPLQLSFVRNTAQYQRLFGQAAAHACKGEASTSYLYSETAARNIYNAQPGMKLIAILRDPADRAFSHYLMALKYGHVRGSFRQALETDIQKKPKGWGRSELFLELGLYGRQLQRYYQTFPENQIHIILYDDFLAQPRRVGEECVHFLGLPLIDINWGQTHANKAETPRHPFINQLLVRSGLKQGFKKIIPQGLYNAFKRMVYTQTKGHSLAPQDRNWLLGYYKEDIALTAKLTGKNLGHWA